MFAHKSTLCTQKCATGATPLLPGGVQFDMFTLSGFTLSGFTLSGLTPSGFTLNSFTLSGFTPSIHVLSHHTIRTICGRKLPVGS